MKCVKVKFMESHANSVQKIIFARYPDLEWGTAFRFGFHDDPEHGLVITVNEIVTPAPGDLNPNVDNVQFMEPYLLRIALAAAKDGFGAGIIHSHPSGYGVRPSYVDDEMDDYFKGYFGDFAPGRPYASLIFAKDEEANSLRISGRVWHRGAWLKVETTIVGKALKRFPVGLRDKKLPEVVLRRLERMTSVIGEESAGRLWESTVVVMGVGGTGSAAAHSLARSCVGRIVLVDFDHISPSNSERLHGFEAKLLNESPPRSKVEVVRDLIKKINPEITVVAIRGNYLQRGVYEELVHADIVLGCSDTNHGRAGLSELTYRYLVPGLQVNVSLEASESALTGQVIQFTRYLPGGACAYCRGQVDSGRMAQEFMTEAERISRKKQAQAAVARGERGDAYWHDDPVVPTVGAVATIAGELAADFAVGMLTARFAPPADFIEMNLLAPHLGVAELSISPKPGCRCGFQIGGGDQSDGGRLHVAPSHWPAPRKK